MSRLAPQPEPAERRRSVRRMTLLGAVLCVPLLATAWLVLPPALVLVSLLVPFVFVAGVLLLAVAATRWWRSRSGRSLPPAAAGVLGIVVATACFAAWPPEASPMEATAGLLVPPGRALHLLYLYVLVGGLWQLGLFVLVGAIGAAVTRRASR